LELCYQGIPRLRFRPSPKSKGSRNNKLLKVDEVILCANKSLIPTDSVGGKKRNHPDSYREGYGVPLASGI